MTTTQVTRLCKDETESLLIVEGKDDCHGIYQIARKTGLEAFFGIWEGGNADGALARFGGLLLATSTRPSKLGIVLDCDADEMGRSPGLVSRWNQIQHRLRGLAYAAPPLPDSKGTILEGPEGYPRIGIWLMPDNQTDGMFEDFLLHLVPPAALNYARETAEQAKVEGYGSYKGVHKAKAIAHTYLAWQDEPGKPLGIAIKAGMFDLDNPNANDFVGWLRDLFDPSPA